MARRFKFRPPPGVIVGTLLIWSPGVWLASESRELREKARQVDASPELEAVVETHELVTDAGGRLDHLVFRTPEAKFDVEIGGLKGLAALQKGERVALRVWHGRVISARDGQGHEFQLGLHPAHTADEAEAVLLLLGLVGMAILVVGALVGGLNEP